MSRGRPVHVRDPAAQQPVPRGTPPPLAGASIQETSMRVMHE